MPEVSQRINVTCLQMRVAMFDHLFVIVNISKCPWAKQGKGESPSIILKVEAVEGSRMHESP